MARFVLVHGAFGGAWCWEPLTPSLIAAGHTVQTLELPGSGADNTPIEQVTLDADADAIGRALATDSEPAVLVGHSMGGVARRRSPAASGSCSRTFRRRTQPSAPRG
jgi:pimeloyl-ACP methyl ester carboxylesterase